MSARVGSLALLSRRGDEPMRVRAEIELGSGDVRWLPEAWPERESSPEGDAARIVELIQHALGSAVVHLVGSRRMGCELRGADVDLVAALPGEVDLRDIYARLVTALPDATRIRRVFGARVPGLRMTIGPLDVDLVTVPTGDFDPAEAVERRIELGEAPATALSAVSDGDAVLRAVGADHAAFASLARQVKAWAAARGLDSAPFGGLPGLAWSCLAARTTAQGNASLASFFEQWAGWDWRQPVMLDGSAGVTLVSSDPISILTPTAPVRSCTAQVSPGMRDLLVEELFRGWEITQETESSDEALRRLCEPPPLHRRHAAWALVTIGAGGEAALDEAVGRVRGRMRALISKFEESLYPTAEVHAWPRSQYAVPYEVGYVIGLGRTPVDRYAFAEVAERWCKGAPGVRVEYAAGGEVSSPAEFGMFDHVFSRYGCLVVLHSV